MHRIPSPKLLLLPLLLLGALAPLVSAAPVRVPFELHNNHIYLKVMVNGKGPYYFLFDTGAGASGSTIDAGAAASLRLPVEGNLNAGMIGGSKSIPFTGLVTYKIGGLVFEEPKTAFLELKEQEKEEGHRVDGIFGYSLIKNYVIEIDYRKRLMTFYEPNEYTMPRKALKLALSDVGRNRVPVVQAAVTTITGKRLDLTIVFDTGYDGSLLLGRSFVEDNNLKFDVFTGSAKSGEGLGGSTSLSRGRIHDLQLGSLKIDRPITVFAFDKEGNFAGDTAYIGGALLKRYKLVLNYRDGFMLLI